MRNRTLFMVGLGIWLSSFSFGQEAERYAVQPTESTFTVKVGRAGFLKIFGHDHRIEVRRYEGEVTWRPDAPESSSVQLEFEAASLTVADSEVSESERQEIQGDMETKVLEIDTYPTIRFDSKQVRITKGNGQEYESTVTGELALHGVTRDVEVPLRFQLSEGELRASGKLKIKGSDFGIEPVSVAGGTVKTKDELELEFDLVATRQD